MEQEIRAEFESSGFSVDDDDQILQKCMISPLSPFLSLLISLVSLTASITSSPLPILYPTGRSTTLTGSVENRLSGQDLNDMEDDIIRRVQTTERCNLQPAFDIRQPDDISHQITCLPNPGLFSANEVRNHGFHIKD
ncbi:hypothetical protein BHE74_00011909 [Ensete ventricosum]|nr:hypothetical protein BHE74_00011909 [Ensete ventricosum]